MKIPALTNLNELLTVWARFSLQYERDTKALAPSVGQLTLAANSATTVFTHQRLSPSTKLVLEPTTANAATAKQTMYWDIGTATGTVTLNHANNAQIDKTFNFAILGI